MMNNRTMVFNPKRRENIKQNENFSNQSGSTKLETRAASKKFLFNRTILFWKRKPRKAAEERNDTGPMIEIPCRHFSMAEIKKATDDFASHLVLGKGAFGTVYKGVIDKGGMNVAIKRRSLTSEQGIKEFTTEMSTLSKLKHAHLVSLVGVCTDNGEKMLLYDYMSNGSLNDLLHSKKNNSPLTWKRRLEICTGAARGLYYLHCNGIIHRDVKSNNILVDENWKAKLSDFGLSREGPRAGGDSYIFTQILGTPGYWDPQYLASGNLTLKSDVYSFGMVLLEVLFGRPPGDRRLPRNQASLPSWARHCRDKRILGDNIDGHLKGKIYPSILSRFVDVAISCVQYEEESRPSMQNVSQILELLLEDDNTSLSSSSVFNMD